MLFVIEVGDDRNRSFHWPVTCQELRGRFSVQNFRPATPDPETGIHEMPDIPGLCIELDTTARRARIFDPLADPKFNEARLEINRIFKKVLRTEIKPVPEVVKEELSDVELNTWQYWMWRYVNAKQPQARVLVGESIPEVEGEVANNPYDWTEVAKKTKRVGQKTNSRGGKSG